MDLLSDEIPPKFYERLRPRILSKVGDRFAYGMVWVAGCHGGKKIGKMGPLALYQNNGEYCGFTRSTCLLNCLIPELTKFH